MDMNNNYSFAQNVRLLALSNDFEKNQDKLSEVKPYLQETFLGCLKLGGMIVPSIRAVQHIEKISRESCIQPIDCIKLASAFRLLNALIDERPESVQEANNSIN